MQDRKQKKKISWTLTTEICRRAENYGTNYEASSKEILHLPRRYENRTSSNHIQELQQKTKKLISRSVSALSFFCIYLKQLTYFHTLFSLVGNHRERMGANKLHIKQTNWQDFMRSALSLTVRLQQGSSWNSRGSAKRIDRSGTNVYLVS